MHVLANLDSSCCGSEVHRKFSEQIQGREHKRDLQAVLKEGDSEKVEGCDSSWI